MFKFKDGTKCYCDICDDEITDYSAVKHTFSLPIITIDQGTNQSIIKHHPVDLCPVCKEWLAKKIKKRMDFNNDL